MRNVILVLSISVAILAALPWRAGAVQSVSLEWSASPSPDVTGYNVRYGLASGVYTEILPVGDNTTAAISGLVEGLTYYFVVTDYDADGIESAPSNEAVYTVPGIAPPGNPSIQTDPASGETILKWNPSPSPGVVGYNVYFISENGDYSELFASGADTEFVLPDWMPGMPFYLFVTACSDDGQESAETTEVSLTDLLAAPATVPGPVLSLQSSPAAGLTGVFSITAAGAVPSAWALEASSDLQVWGTLATGSDPAVNVTVVVSPKPRLFFRLASLLPDVQLQTQTPPDAFPNSFCINTADTAPSEWTVQASEDLQTWNPLTSGTGTSVKLAVVTAAAPSLFFRLKSL